MLTVAHLTPDHCLSLAARMRKPDMDECWAAGHSPLEALLWGIRLGFAVAVIREEDGECVGAFGVNLEDNAIWSLWCSRMSWQEQFQILKQTPAAVRGLVALAGGARLHNLVDIRNKSAVEWLERSGCFDMSDTIEQIGGGSYLRFITKEGPSAQCAIR